MTFRGGVDYILWKIERHSGVKVEVPLRLQTLPAAGNLRDLLETLPQEGLPLKTFIAQIPKIHLLFFGKMLGNLLYYLAVPQRRIVRRNLQFSHVESSPQQLQSLSKRIFRHFGITILELLQMTCFSQKELLRYVDLEGKEIFTRSAGQAKRCCSGYGPSGKL